MAIYMRDQRWSTYGRQGPLPRCQIPVQCAQDRSPYFSYFYHDIKIPIFRPGPDAPGAEAFPAAARTHPGEGLAQTHPGAEGSLSCRGSNAPSHPGDTHPRTRTLETRTLETRTLETRTLETRTLETRTLETRTLETRTLENVWPRRTREAEAFPSAARTHPGVEKEIKQILPIKPTLPEHTPWSKSWSLARQTCRMPSQPPCRRAPCGQHWAGRSAARASLRRPGARTRALTCGGSGLYPKGGVPRRRRARGPQHLAGDVRQKIG